MKGLTSHQEDSICLDFCISCGTKMVSYQCMAHFWVNECLECQKKKVEKMKQDFLTKSTNEIMKYIEDEVFRKLK